MIVGAGSPGSVLANRLSEIHHCKVLLIEAGVDVAPIADVPMGTETLQVPHMDWQFKSVLQGTSCFAMKNDQCN